MANPQTKPEARNLIKKKVQPIVGKNQRVLSMQELIKEDGKNLFNSKVPEHTKAFNYECE